MGGRGTWAGLLASRGSIEERAENLWEESGIPERFKGLRLSTHPLLQGPRGDKLKRMVAGKKPPEGFWGQSWYLWGNVGVGKTGLATSYAYQWVDPAYGEPARVAYVTVPELLGRLRASYDAQAAGRKGETEWEVIQRFREADLLILDDLGSEQPGRSSWAEDRLLMVAGWRHDECLPTVYTSNLSPREIAQQVGERVVWRIIESCGRGNVVHVEGPNLRAPE